MWYIPGVVSIALEQHKYLNAMDKNVNHMRKYVQNINNVAHASISQWNVVWARMEAILVF